MDIQAIIERQDPISNDNVGTQSQPIESTPAAVTTQAETKTAKTLEEVRAARLSAATTPAATETPKPEEKKTETPATTETTINFPEQALKQIATLTAETVELKRQAKEFESAKSHAEKMQSAAKLLSEGKHLEAAELLGINLTKANEQLLGMTLSDPEEEKRKAAEDAEKTELQKTIDELKTDSQRRKEAEQLEARQAGIEATHDYVKENAKDFIYLSRNPKWVDAALTRAEGIAKDAVAQLKRPLTPDEADKVVAYALREEEKQRVEDAQVYGVRVDPRNGNSAAVTPTKDATSSQATIDSALRGSVSTQQQSRQRMSYEDVKKRRREARN